MVGMNKPAKGVGSGPPPSWILIAALALAIVVFGGATPAFGQEKSPIFAGPPIDFYGGTKILGGRTTEPNGTTISLTPSDALAFMQSWLPDSVSGHPAQQTPPPTLKRGTVVVGVLDIDGKSKISARVLYAVRGATVWVGMPKQTLWANTAVTKESWIVASFPAKLLAAAEGKGAPYLAPPATTAPTTNAAAAREPTSSNSSKSSSSSTWVWIVVGLALLALLIVIGWARRLRAARVGLGVGPAERGE